MLPSRKRPAPEDDMQAMSGRFYHEQLDDALVLDPLVPPDQPPPDQQHFAEMIRSYDNLFQKDLTYAEQVCGTSQLKLQDFTLVSRNEHSVGFSQADLERCHQVAWYDIVKRRFIPEERGDVQNIGRRLVDVIQTLNLEVRGFVVFGLSPRVEAAESQIVLELMTMGFLSPDADVRDTALRLRRHPVLFVPFALAVGAKTCCNYGLSVGAAETRYNRDLQIAYSVKMFTALRSALHQRRDRVAAMLAEVDGTDYVLHLRALRLVRPRRVDLQARAEKCDCAKEEGAGGVNVQVSSGGGNDMAALEAKLDNVLAGHNGMQFDAFWDQLCDKMNDFSDKVDGKFDDLDAKFTALDDKFDALDTKFSALSTQFVALDTKVTTLGGRMDAVDTALTGSRNAVDAIATAVTENRTAIASIDTQVVQFRDGITGAITGVKTTVDQIKVDTDEIKGKIANIDRTLVANAGQAGANADAVAIRRLIDEVTANTAAVRGFKEDIDRELDKIKDGVDRNTVVVTTLQTGVDTNTAAVATLSADVTSGMGRLTAGITANAEAVTAVGRDVAANTAGIARLDEVIKEEAGHVKTELVALKESTTEGMEKINTTLGNIMELFSEFAASTLEAQNGYSTSLQEMYNANTAERQRLSDAIGNQIQQLFVQHLGVPVDPASNVPIPLSAYIETQIALAVNHSFAVFETQYSKEKGEIKTFIRELLLAHLGDVGTLDNHGQTLREFIRSLIQPGAAHGAASDGIIEAFNALAEQVASVGTMVITAIGPRGDLRMTVESLTEQIKQLEDNFTRLGLHVAESLTAVIDAMARSNGPPRRIGADPY